MSDDNTGLVVVGALLGTALLGGVVIAVTAQPRQRSLPSAGWQTEPSFSDADVEAGARMLASENPHASRDLHIEQVWTQLRAAKRGQSLFDRITGGIGWGPQGGKRPVATVEYATDELRQLVREVLAGDAPSKFAGARKFFDPKQQDLAFAVGERARAKIKAGQPLTPQEERLKRYKRNAEGVRRKWVSEGARYVNSVDGVEFYT
jgi:hypothetical protein